MFAFQFILIPTVDVRWFIFPARTQNDFSFNQLIALSNWIESMACVFPHRFGIIWIWKSVFFSFTQNATRKREKKTIKIHRINCIYRTPVFTGFNPAYHAWHAVSMQLQYIFGLKTHQISLYVYVYLVIWWATSKAKPIENHTLNIHNQKYSFNETVIRLIFMLQLNFQII